ncbi:methyltransferase family protein [Pseudoalteromonas denitrificans]|uniref:Protein-S-isoprenylcysteine O-methyltransferase Ste14 n=1 Tax=Pseudoalteromonas denitrificans DSM 6059 TaxID=1123010 RepID=A0A1I1TNG7_9GAMM|nr:isoprenylcysteine carboxylmethyltransferase family protein [Pseudoalteromonas denitrificans]SFD60024.1 Protein-S-isoprenylcysteine O-methyltransferase Ste14 [Pseudoalteromonas denitrificans DSM 6059]
MHKFENKIPPPIVVLFVGLVMWGAALVTPVQAINQMIQISLIVITLCLGIFFCIAGVVSFKLAKTTVNPLKPEAASSLVSSGIYKVSRNPMYLGFVLFLIAWAVYLASFIAGLGIIVFIIYMNQFQIIPEEKALKILFSSEFEVYQLKVRRWL